MNSEIKAQWLTALRSGEYEQGTGALKRTAGKREEFCCLGVLCDLAIKAGVVSDWETEEFDSIAVGPIRGITLRKGTETEYFETAILPEEVRDWAGLGTRGGLRNSAVALTELNDSGYGFAEIANVIEGEF